MIRGHPEWTDRGLEWLEAFDTIDLCELLDAARANRASVPRRASIAAALWDKLTSKFDRPAPEATEPIPPPRQAPVVAVAAAGDILRGMEATAKYLGLDRAYLTYLVESGTLPTFKMPGSQAVCARKSSLTAAVAGMEQAATGATSTGIVGL